MTLVLCWYPLALFRLLARRMLVVTDGDSKLESWHCNPDSELLCSYSRTFCASPDPFTLQYSLILSLGTLSEALLHFVKAV